MKFRIAPLTQLRYVYFERLCNKYNKYEIINYLKVSESLNM